MTTFLLLTMIASQPPQAPPFLVAPPQAPAIKADRVAELWAKVKGGAEVTVYVGQEPPKGAKDAVRLESFDGEKSGAFRCFLHDGEPSYEKVETTAAPLIPLTLSPEKTAGTGKTVKGHEHKCASCGTVWAHPDNDPTASHSCPSCGRSQYRQYRDVEIPVAPKAAPVTKKRVSMNGRWYDQYSDGRLVECTA